MKILFIGGTKFVGRQTVEDALSLGHVVHILQRGKTNPGLFKEVTRYLGDRENIAQLIPPSEKFDIVVDSCGYHPEIVKKSCEYLKDKTQLYVFISTGSVYADFSKPMLNEKSKVASLAELPPPSAPITNENYGPLKALCEEVVIQSLGTSKSLILRPGIIVGPYDDTKRFDRLIGLIGSIKEVTIPSNLKIMIQFLDVRALSHFILNSIDNKRFGIYNLIGPRESITYQDFIRVARGVLNPDLKINLTPADTKTDLPMYLDNLKFMGMFQIDGSLAYKHGLKEIPIENTIKATHDYLTAYSNKLT